MIGKQMKKITFSYILYTENEDIIATLTPSIVSLLQPHQDSVMLLSFWT